MRRRYFEISGAALQTTIARWCNGIAFWYAAGVEVSTFLYGNLLIIQLFSMNAAIFFQCRCARAESDSRS